MRNLNTSNERAANMTTSNETKDNSLNHALNERGFERRRLLTGAAGAALAFTGLGGLEQRAVSEPAMLPDTLVAFAGVGLNAADLEASRAFYRDGLGLKEFLILPPPPGTTANVEAVFTRSGTQDDGAILTLADRKVIGAMYPTLAPAEGRPSFGRLTSAAADGPAILERLRQAGARTVSFAAAAAKFSETSTFGHAHIAYDPDGYIVEIFTGAVTDLVPGALKASSNPAPSLIDRFVGLELNVSDIGRSLHFYKDVLGMREMMRIPGDSARAVPPRVVLTISGTLQGGALVLAPSDSAAADSTGFGRVLCQTADPTAAVKRLRGAGYAQTASRGSRAEHLVKDPDGFVVELFPGFDAL